MNIAKLLFLVSLPAYLTACGGSPDITCDDPQRYQASREGQRIVAPDGLNDLSANSEMKIPDSSPTEPRPPGSPCLDRPPDYVSPSGEYRPVNQN